ncbi:putative UBA/THIF-type NAD/FAD binding protein [Actinacidiphila reveromycinica]|uniref:Putative UBA/THIF-type NAD/FAD binding protein n=1 Tax=Actinacidiphila reveromycinica TaxID=659352 RepID=A0A7U3UTS9_9ACTN|nr:ThiF family adenylyltransferase [Streptomyces sp. SN-593]BBA98481.1 putative UBA/THIF-type NAD/FAD binding protein [Streptomyces sp. SN-593]
MLILIPTAAAGRFRTAGSWGRLSLRISRPDGLAVVSGISERTEGAVLSVDPAELGNRLLAGCDPVSTGYWYRAAGELHAHWYQVRARRGTSLPLDIFKSAVPSGFKAPGSSGYAAITYTPAVQDEFPESGLPDLLAWHVTRTDARPLDASVEPEVTGIRQLQHHWPVEELQSARVMLVGAGSIGSATAHALAGYGIGHLTLVDPDRLLWHNLVRHTSSRKQIGRAKVTALAEELALLRPDTAVTPLALDVIEHADRIRALLTDTDIVVCAADGVAARRVTGHLARRAGRTAVLACVLQDGAVGEVLRLRPWTQHGCLSCRRESLAEAGGLDPEPALDAGYGTGTRHRPMTAVGPDLHLVAHLAAKTVVATLLERVGHPDQRLPGEHALLALRRQPGWAAPFDLDRTGELRWLPATPPRPGCPTCESP